MKALILAAGNGTRMQPVTKGQHKSLMPLLGLKIIERVILGAKKAGINEFVIVTGYKGKELRTFLNKGEKYGVSITFIHNNKWEKANGISALLAKDYLKENFALLMSDHVFDPETLIKIQKIKLKKNECALAIDRNLDRVLDVDDTTKVFIKKGNIISLNKDLTDYNAYDTGMFICSPHLFEVLEKSTSLKKNSLSDGMRIIAKEGNLRCMDNDGNFWSDCDTWEDIKFAEKKLLASMSQAYDGLISKKFNRKVSTFIAKYLIYTPITPNKLSFIIVLLAIPTFFLLATGIYPWLIFGGLLIQFMSILDGVDGEIARMKFKDTTFGGFLDANLDKYIDTLAIAGMTLGYFKITENLIIIPIALFLIFLLGLDGYMPNFFKAKTGVEMRLDSFKVINVKRDLRLLILALGAIFNLILLSFVILTIFYQLKVVARLYLAKKMTEEAESLNIQK